MANRARTSLSTQTAYSRGCKSTLVPHLLCTLCEYRQRFGNKVQKYMRSLLLRSGAHDVVNSQKSVSRINFGSGNSVMILQENTFQHCPRMSELKCIYDLCRVSFAISSRTGNIKPLYDRKERLGRRQQDHKIQRCE